MFHNLDIDMMIFTSPQDKVTRSQLELVTSDPGRLLAWLVLLSTLVTKEHIYADLNILSIYISR